MRCALICMLGRALCADSLQLLADRQRSSAETTLPCCRPPPAAAVSVRHCLLALPGVQKGDIKRVLSHPQALAQTDSYTRRMPGVVREAVDDTGERRTRPALSCPAATLLDGGQPLRWGPICID